MSKMLFTFRWGKSVYVTDKDLKKILLQYYTKTEVDEILKRYAKIEDVAAELVEYAKLDDLNVLDNYLQGLINDNTDLINGNTEILNEIIDALKNARLWNIVGMWDSGTTYKIGDVVGYTNNELYLSIVDDNLNHIPSDTPSNWIRVTNVQSFNLDDYYNKMQVDVLLSNKADKTDLTQYAKLDKDNTYADGKRNIFRTLPEVYTQATLPTKNTDLTTKKYVDDNFLRISNQAGIGKQVDERLNINGLLSMRDGHDIELVDSSGYKSIHKNGNNLQWGGKNLATEEYVNNKVGTGGGSGSGINAKRVGIRFYNTSVMSSITVNSGDRVRTDFRTSSSVSDSYVDFINTSGSEFRDALYEGRLIFGGQRLKENDTYKSFGFIDKMYCDGSNWLYMWWINLSTSQQTWNFKEGQTYYFTMILN